jgi:hypothetical protein
MVETDETRAPDDADTGDMENEELEDPADEAAGEQRIKTGPPNPPDSDDD